MRSWLEKHGQGLVDFTLLALFIALFTSILWNMMWGCRF